MSPGSLSSQRLVRPARALGALYAALIMGGSVVLVAVPLAGVWLLSQIGSASLFIYVLVLVGAAAAMVGWGGLLARLDRRRAALLGDDAAGVLPTCLSVAVLIAIAVVIVWAVLIAVQGADVRGPFPD